VLVVDTHRSRRPRGLTGQPSTDILARFVDDPSTGPSTPSRRGSSCPESDKLAQRADLATLLARARATARRAAARAAPAPDRSDLAQSVVRELLRVADRLDYRGEAAFDALVRSIFVHKLRKKLRRAHAGKRDVRREMATAGTEVGEVPVPVDRSPSNDPVQMALAADLRARLQARIEELAAREREVILLRASGLTAGEVAAKLGLTEANAQKIYTRTRAELEAALLDEGTS